MSEHTCLPPAYPQLDALVRELTHASQLSTANLAQVLQIQRTTTTQQRTPTAAATASSLRHLRDLRERKQVFTFVKVLFKYLEKSKAVRLHMRAKKVIAECIRENRVGNPSYMPLGDAIEQRLYQTVGDRHWSRAKACFSVYCTKKHDRSLASL